jgi:hypothetical protein
VFSNCCSPDPHSKRPSTVALYVIVPVDSAGIFQELSFHVSLVFHSFTPDEITSDPLKVNAVPLDVTEVKSDTKLIPSGNISSINVPEPLVVKVTFFAVLKLMV